MKLRVLENYTSNRFVARNGEIVDVPEELARWLLNDAPRCFVVYDDSVEYRDIEQVAKLSDRMQRHARKR